MGRRSCLPVVTIIGIVLVTGSVLGIILNENGPAKGVTETMRSPCDPRLVKPSTHVIDRYDRQVLSLDPSLYLTLGNQLSAAEPDLSGNGHAGIYEPSSRAPLVLSLPNGDMATVFNGNDQFVEVPSAPSLSITATRCLTVEAWVKPTVLQFPHDQGSGYVYILGKGVTGKQEYALRMYSHSNSETPPEGRIGFLHTPLTWRAGERYGAYFQDKVDPADWMMLSFVIDSRPSGQWPDGYIAIYKNGQMQGSQVSLAQFNVTPKASDAPFRIGTRDLESFFEGAIGKVAVYNSVLSAKDILTTYNAMMSPNA